MKLFNRFLIAAIALLGGCLIFPAGAQNVNTPYSMYGYGILNDHATATQKQMGGIGIAMRSGRQVNCMNPASYAAIDSLTFLFDMGADLSLLWSKDGNVKEHSTGGGLDYLTIQVPFSKYVGGSMGILPYSSVGYSFGNDIKHGTRSNQGSGGLNQAYLGVGGTYAGFSAGVNVYYMFGTITNDIYANPENSSSTLFEHILQVRDWNLVAGLQYTQNINRYNRITIGATYSPKKSLHGNTWATFQNIVSGEDAKPDTVGYSKIGGRYYQPNSFGVGLNFNHDRQSHFMAEVDFTYQDWKNAKYSPLLDEEGEVIFQGMDFDNRWRVSGGVEYRPALRGSYLKRITYRAGAYYTHDYLNIRGNHVKEYGITCGFGFPTAEGKTTINLGLEWKRRVASPHKLLSENYFNITLGVNFNEVWFWKRKLR